MDTETLPDPATGLSLKLLRTARRVRANRLGAAMGVSGRRISNIEGMQFPPETLVKRYVAALDTCAPSAASKVA